MARKEPSDYIYIKTIDFAVSEQDEIDNSWQMANKQLQEIDVACGTIDESSYQLLVGFRDPSSLLKIYDFEEKNQFSKVQSQPFPTDITGMYFVSNVLNGKDVVIVGTMGGTIHVWDLRQQRSISKLSGHMTAPRVFFFDPGN